MPYLWVPAGHRRYFHGPPAVATPASIALLVIRLSRMLVGNAPARR